jgi:uncharacterized membrane protein YbhN (UPF0104 family)
MKKVLVTVLQLAVTIALLIWVFHDPGQRHKMGKALQEADYRWVAAAIVAYVIVEIAAAIRWQIPPYRLVFDRDVLQPISPRRNRRRYY